MSASTASAAPAPPASASTATRRTLTFGSLAEILADVEHLDGAGPLVGLGEWTPAQILDHVRRGMVVAREGAGFTMPLPMRVIGRVFKSYFLRNTFKAGIKMPSVARDTFAPAEHITWNEAASAFREEVAAASQPNAMTTPSPLLGPLSHHDWERLHCRHAELHFAFIVPERVERAE
ncbi:MAG: DUF1569 domain-containing protein [Phycisphaerales bacterium]